MVGGAKGKAQRVRTRGRVVAGRAVGAVGAGVGRIIRDFLLRRPWWLLDLLDVGRLVGRGHLLGSRVRRGIVGGGGRLLGRRLMGRLGVLLLLLVLLVVLLLVVRVRVRLVVRVLDDLRAWVVLLLRVRVVGWRWQALLLRVGVMLEDRGQQGACRVEADMYKRRREEGVGGRGCGVQDAVR